MKALIYLLCLSSVFSTVAQAAKNDHYLGAGINLDTFNENLPARFELDDKFVLAPVLGWKSTFLWDNVGFRTGVFGEYKKVRLDDNLAVAGKGDVSITAYYLAAPLNLLFQATNRFSIFGGITPRLLVLKSCEDCESFDDSPTLLTNTYNIGGAFEVNSDVSVEVNFQQAIDESFDDLKINTAQALVYWKL